MKHVRRLSALNEQKWQKQRREWLLSPNATATEHGCCLPKHYEFAVCVRTPLLQSMAAVHTQQRNIDNGRMRTIRLIWILEEDATPQWTGQIPR